MKYNLLRYWHVVLQSSQWRTQAWAWVDVWIQSWLCVWGPGGGWKWWMKQKLTRGLAASLLVPFIPQRVGFYSEGNTNWGLLWAFFPSLLTLLSSASSLPCCFLQALAWDAEWVPEMLPIAGFSGSNFAFWQAQLSMSHTDMLLKSCCSWQGI